MRTAVQRIFVAEDDAEMRAFLAEQLRANGYAVSELCDGVELLERLQEVRGRRLEWPIVTDELYTALLALDGPRSP